MKHLRKKRSKKKTKLRIMPVPRSVKLLRISFWSGVRKPRVLLRADLMLVDEGNGAPLTTLITVVDSKTKNVVATVEAMRVLTETVTGKT